MSIVGLPTLAHDLGRALTAPRNVWDGLRRWAQLARCAELPYVKLVRYRQELHGAREFQAHLARHSSDVQYIAPPGAELYAFIRAMKPETVVETGVASGVSSAHILLALAANRKGTLHSIDLPNVQDGSYLPDGRTSGWIVPDGLRARWQLQLGDSRSLLPELLDRLGRVDVFMHDSDHSYDYMRFEFEQVFPYVKPGGLLMSDDTHLHRAWDDFCGSHGLRPTRMDRLGIARKRIRHED